MRWVLFQGSLNPTPYVYMIPSYNLFPNAIYMTATLFRSYNTHIFNCWSLGPRVRFPLIDANPHAGTIPPPPSTYSLTRTEYTMCIHNQRVSSDARIGLLHYGYNFSFTIYSCLGANSNRVFTIHVFIATHGTYKPFKYSFAPARHSIAARYQTQSTKCVVESPRSAQ